MKASNIVLIGMPSSGKSTVGKILSKMTGMNFIDIDSNIINKEGKKPRDIVNDSGLEEFLKVQEDAVVDLNVKNHIIATGGSVVYSEKSMNHLKSDGIIIYLKTDFESINKRAGKNRRLAREKGKSLYDVYCERKILYEKYSDIAIDSTDKNSHKIALEIKNYIKKTRGKK